MKFTERLRDENYAGPMQHLRSHVEIDALFNQAADIIDEMQEIIQWFIENDDTNEGDEPMPEFGGKSWDEINKHWIDGLNRGRNVLERLA